MATGATLTATRARASAKARAPFITLAGLRGVAARVLPPLVVLAGFLLLWEVLCSSPTAGLPPPPRAS